MCQTPYQALESKWLAKTWSSSAPGWGRVKVADTDASKPRINKHHEKWGGGQ